MGCDIHCYCEVRKDGKWERTGAIFPSKYHDPAEVIERDGYTVYHERENGVYTGKETAFHVAADDTESLRRFAEDDDYYVWNGPFTTEPYEGRSYELFALLAGVRNYDYVTPIHSPRGVPSDVSETVRKIIDRWGVDGHSHSYFTVAELKKRMHRIRFASKHFADAVERMSELGAPEDVRIVFFFDN